MSEKPVQPSDLPAASVQLLGDIRKMIEETRAEYGKEIVATLSRQLSWTHFIALIPLKENYEELGI